MSAVQEWAQGKHYIIQLLAPSLANLVEVFYEELSHLKRRRIARHNFPLPRFRPWFALYRSHRKSNEYLKLLFSTIICPEAVELFNTPLTELQKAKPASQTEDEKHSPEAAEEINKLVRDLKKELLAASFEYLEDEFAKKPVDPEMTKAVQKLVVNNPLETSFFVFVTAPCWLLYRMPPSLLYRKARLGDMDALKKLLRLDQLMLHDSFIGQQVVAVRFNHNVAKYQNMVEAATKSPIIDRKNIVLSIAGLIYAISFLTSKPLTPRDIIDLFGAIAEDTNKEELLNSIPKDSKSLGRELQPDRNYWRKIFDPGQKNVNSMSDLSA